MRLGLVVIFISLASLLAAQPDGGGPGGDPDATPPVPLGGVEILISAGLIYGIKKIRDNTRNNS